VNLEKRLAKPEALRTPQRSIPERHGVLNNNASPFSVAAYMHSRLYCAGLANRRDGICEPCRI
jgi:hypothetical protein